MVVSKSLLYYIATIDRLQRNHNKLENKKKELKQKLFEKMEVCCMLLSWDSADRIDLYILQAQKREIDELQRLLDLDGEIGLN